MSEIKLAPLSKSDLPELYGWINDRNVVSFNAPYRPITPSQHIEWYERITNSPEVVIFAIRDIENKMIGTTQLHSINPIHRSAEFQIRIGKEEDRNKGVGSEALQQVLKIAFLDLNLNRVTAKAFETNTRAIKVYERAGFIKEGSLREACFINGNYTNLIVLGILKSEWRSKYDCCNSPA